MSPGHLIILTIAGSMLTSAIVRAQDGAQQSVARAAAPVSTPISCLDTVSSANGPPSVAYIHADFDGSPDTSFTQMADIFAQSVAQHARILLHQHGDTLPTAEPLLTWRNIISRTPLYVTVFHDTRPARYQLRDYPDSSVAALLLRAAHAADNAGESTFWPGGETGDSLMFVLELQLTAPGQIRLTDVRRVGFPAFSVMFPPRDTVARTHGPAPVYPSDALAAGVMGMVNLRFTVDSTGNTLDSTIKEIPPVAESLPTGERIVYYNEFLHAATQWLASARFTPARIGGCPVQQTVEHPFKFTITH
jgi:hypothetical protein